MEEQVQVAFQGDSFSPYLHCFYGFCYAVSSSLNRFFGFSWTSFAFSLDSWTWEIYLLPSYGFFSSPWTSSGFQGLQWDSPLLSNPPRQVQLSEADRPSALP